MKSSDNNHPQENVSAQKAATAVVGNALVSGMVKRVSEPYDLQTLQTQLGAKPTVASGRHLNKIGLFSTALSGTMGAMTIHGPAYWRDKARLTPQQSENAVAASNSLINTLGKQIVLKARDKAAGTKKLGEKPSIAGSIGMTAAMTFFQQTVFLGGIRRANQRHADEDGKLSPLGFMAANAEVSAQSGSAGAIASFSNNYSRFSGMVGEQIRKGYQQSGWRGVLNKALPKSAAIAGVLGASSSHALASTLRGDVHNPIPEEVQTAVYTAGANTYQVIHQNAHNITEKVKASYRSYQENTEQKSTGQENLESKKAVNEDTENKKPIGKFTQKEQERRKNTPSKGM